VILSLQEAELFLDAVARLGNSELERLARLMRSLENANKHTTMMNIMIRHIKLNEDTQGTLNE